jgi:hypothetical protein
LITVCIECGVDRPGQIIGVLQQLGFDRRHIGAVLTKGKKPYWRRDNEGRYTLTVDHPLPGKSTPPDEDA